MIALVLFFLICVSPHITLYSTYKGRKVPSTWFLLSECKSYPLLSVCTDDAAVIICQDSENQHLLNDFSIGCQWSNMIIWIDRCFTTGIKTFQTKSAHYLPKLIINSPSIPTRIILVDIFNNLEDNSVLMCLDISTSLK